MAGFAEAEGAAVVFTAGVAFGDEPTGFPAAIGEFTDTAFVCDADAAGLPVATVFTDTAFVCDADGAVLAADAFACTETAFFLLAATLAALTFAPLGEGLPPCAACVVAGFTLTDAGWAGVCPAVGLCANAATERTMSMPRFRIIYVLPLAVAGVAAG